MCTEKGKKEKVRNYEFMQVSGIFFTQRAFKAVSHTQRLPVCLKKEKGEYNDDDVASATAQQQP
jgi:hypothetical protein